MATFPIIYSTLSNVDLLHYIIEKYKISKNAAITFIKRGFNDTYLITENSKKYILRVYKYQWKNNAEIETEVNLLNLLFKNNISVSRPIADKNNGYIQTINAPEGIRNMVLFSFAEGISIKKLNTQQAFLLGCETGKIHNITQNTSIGKTVFNYNFETQFNETLKTLEPILIPYREQYEYLRFLKKEFTIMWASINEQEVAKGICHGDLQAENFHISSENKFTFFDFDFIGSGYLIYDIGVFIWYDHKNKPKEIINSFLEGYQSQRTLTETEIKLIPYFSTLRALFQMTVYCKISDGNQLPVWPADQVAAFINKVKSWFEKEVKKTF